MDAALTAQALARFGAAVVVGALVALSLGIYGTVHEATGRSLVTLLFSNTLRLKVWLATLVVVLAVAEFMTGLRMKGRLGKKRGPRWVPRAHRLTGTLAFLFAIPVAYHCLWALGFHWSEGPRIFVHGLAGCLFFGALATKVVSVRGPGMPSWALPVLGGTLFTTLVAVWATSAFWFVTKFGVPGL